MLASTFSGIALGSLIIGGLFLLSGRGAYRGIIQDYNTRGTALLDAIMNNTNTHEELKASVQEYSTAMSSDYTSALRCFAVAILLGLTVLTQTFDGFAAFSVVASFVLLALMCYEVFRARKMYFRVMSQIKSE